MQIEFGWHRLLRKIIIHASRPTGKPRFFPEVPLAMMCGVMGDMVSPSFELLNNGCIFMSYGFKGRQDKYFFTKEIVKTIDLSSI